MRKTTFEIDIVTGCKFPPNRVRHKGRDHTLASIYADAGMELDIIQGESGLPPLPADSPFDLVSLHRYMVNYRAKQRLGWYGHILIVPHIAYQDGYYTKRPVGVMYDFRSYGENTVAREGCAISYDKVRDNEKMYLRTLAHEIGHVFNLLHPNQSRPRQPYDTTIMNQTKILQAKGNFPDNIRYEFSEANKRFLSRAPAYYVKPGGAPFGRRPHPISRMATDEAFESTRGLTFTISTATESYVIGEPVWLRMSLRNDSGETLVVNPHLTGGTDLVEVVIIDPLNQETIFHRCYYEDMEPEEIELVKGQELLGNLPIFFGAEGYSFRFGGIYQVYATYQAIVKGEKLVSAISNMHEFEITEPLSPADVDYSDLLLINPDQALFMILRGGSHLEGAVDSWTTLVRRFAKSRSAQHARLSLAQNILHNAKDSTSALPAIELLDSIDTDYLDLEQQAEMLGATSQAYAMTGDHNRATYSIDQFRDVVMRGIPHGERTVDDLRQKVRLFSGL